MLSFLASLKYKFVLLALTFLLHFLNAVSAMGVGQGSADVTDRFLVHSYMATNRKETKEKIHPNLLRK